MKTPPLTPLQQYNSTFEHYLLRTTYSNLKRTCDNPHLMFKESRVVKPHGVSYALFEQHVGHRYSKKCPCIMCQSITRGQVIGILPEPVSIEQKVARKPFTMPIYKMPEQPKPRAIIPVRFED